MPRLASADGSTGLLVALSLWTPLLLGLTVYVSHTFLVSLQVVASQAQGKCYDGRHADQPLNVAHFQVMSEQPVFKQRVEPQTVTPELLCNFPVTVYLCPSWASFKECNQDPAELPMFQRARTEGTGVFCWGVLGFYMWGSHPCEDQIWNCTTDGLCNGYQKSERLCAARLDRAAYPCFFDPDNAEVGIKDERFTYSILAGLVCVFLGLLTSACSCFLVYFATGSFYRNFDSMSDFFQQFSLLTLFCGRNARFAYVIIAAMLVIVSLEVVFFVLLLPGQSYYSLWGAPQLADPVSVQLSHVPHGAEHAVPVGFNQPSFGARVLRVFILVLQIYLGIAMIGLCIWAGFKWHSRQIGLLGPRSDRYQRIPPERD